MRNKTQGSNFIYLENAFQITTDKNTSKRTKTYQYDRIVPIDTINIIYLDDFPEFGNVFSIYRKDGYNDYFVEANENETLADFYWRIQNPKMTTKNKKHRE